jgi:hypothetical protein
VGVMGTLASWEGAEGGSILGPSPDGGIRDGRNG